MLQIWASSACRVENSCWSVMSAGANRERERELSPHRLRFSYRRWQRVMTVKWKDDAAGGTSLPGGCNWDTWSPHAWSFVHTNTHPRWEIESRAAFSSIRWFHNSNISFRLETMIVSCNCGVCSADLAQARKGPSAARLLREANSTSCDHITPLLTHLCRLPAHFNFESKPIISYFRLPAVDEKCTFQLVLHLPPHLAF